MNVCMAKLRNIMISRGACECECWFSCFEVKSRCKSGAMFNFPRK